MQITEKQRQEIDDLSWSFVWHFWQEYFMIVQKKMQTRVQNNKSITQNLKSIGII